MGDGTYHEDKPPVFILADRGSGETYAHPAKAAEESTIRLLLGDRQQESLTGYTDGFRAYEPLDEDDGFGREYVAHGEGEYADGDVHVNTCESQRCWRDGGSRRIEASPETNSHRISERYSFGNASPGNPATKRSQPSSKLRYDATILYP